MVPSKCIILPTDFSDGASEAVRYACALTEQFHAELHVLHVIQDIASQLPDFWMGLSIPALRESFSDQKDRLEAAAIKELAKVLPDGWEHGKKVVLATRFGHPALEIIRYARQHHADLIVMGTHGRSALRHLLMGSIAEQVVRKAHCGVLTVPPAGHAFVHPIETAPEELHVHHPKAIIRHNIEELYGQCPMNDFPAANAWAHSIDWERVKAVIDRTHPDFPWKKRDLPETEAAEMMITNVRHEMLHDAGSRS